MATRAHVSKTTVSHVLSGKRPVAPATRVRVNAAIAELGYRPDGLARSLRTRRSHMVALVIPDITNPFYPVLARGLEDGMQGGGYRTFICNSDGRLEFEEEFLHEAVDRGVDGIVMDSFSMRSDRLSARVRNGVSVVRVGTTAIDDPGFDAVHANDRRGAVDAVRHLIGRGCRRVAMIQGPAGAGRKRNEGYLQALDEAGIPHDPELVVSGEWTREGGEMAALRLLELEDPPTAIFCANDLLALGVLQAMYAAGITVPDDLAIVGYDDIEFAAAAAVPLTSVRQPAVTMGALAAELLLEETEAETGTKRHEHRRVVLQPELVVRRSSLSAR